MFDLIEYEQLVDAIEYRPGWSFRVYHDPFEGYMLRIEATVTDSASLLPDTLGINTYIPPMNTEEQFYEFLLWRLCRIETHEAREFFKVKGERYKDPGHV